MAEWKERLFCASACVRAVGGERDHDASESKIVDQDLPAGSGHLQASPRSKVQGPRSEKRGDGVRVRSGHFREQGPGPDRSAKRDGTRCFTEKIPAKSIPARARPKGRARGLDWDGTRTVGRD